MENIKERKMINTKLQEEKNELIKKYPFNGRSKYLIDKFYIIGYEPNHFKKLIIKNKQNKKYLEKVAKRIKKEETQNSNSGKKNTEQKLFIEELPTLLNEISNDYKKKLPDIDLINNMIFPNKATIYMKGKYTKKNSLSRLTSHDISILKTRSNPVKNSDNIIKVEKYSNRETMSSISSIKDYNEEDNLKLMKSKQYNIIFSYNPQEGKNSKKSINGFAYIFYKKYKEIIPIKDINFTFYIPMAFCIISEYPYYNSFYKLSEQIIQLFQSKNEIPIEIILYNIINFSMSPINGDILLNIRPNIFPSEKTLVESLNIISKKKQFHIIKEEDENEKDNNDKYDEFVLYEDDENNEEINNENNILKCKSINEKSNMNKSPVLKTNKRNTMCYNFQKSEKKEKNEKNDLDLSKNFSPDLSDPSRKRTSTNSSLDSISRLKLIKIAGLNEDISYNNKKNKSDFEEIKFPILSGYPLIQYNLSKVLLNNLSPQDVIIIFFYSFLERSILFFSEDLEYLSFTINSYLNLNYPLNDEKYYFYNACVSYENFINGNSPFVGTTFTSILGINSPYNTEYLKSSNITKLKEHLAVDLDNGVLIQVEDPSNKDKNLQNKSFFDFIKKICKKEIKDDKGILLAREVRILYEKLEICKNNINDNGNNRNFAYSTNTLYKITNNNNFIDYNEDGQNSIKMNNKTIQEGFYRLINYICLYFYKKLSLKSDDDKNKLNEVIINRKQKRWLNPETMNIIFHKDEAESHLSKDEIYLLDELIETMKFDSFVFGFIQSYDPIDLYKIPLTLTEEFISILSRQNLLINQNINFVSFIENLYKKNGNEIVYIDFNPFSAEYFKKMKNYFDREILDDNNHNNTKKKFKDKYIKVLLSQREEGLIIDGLQYNEYILDNNLLLKYMRYLKNIKKEEYYHMFHLASSLELNKIKKITIFEIENEMEKYLNNSEIISKKDICCSNIILLFILSLKSIQKYIDCQSFLSALFQNFNVFRKYYSMIMNLVYRLMNECLETKDYINAQNYFFCYYSCINSLRSLKLVPNENLMNIILKFDKIDLNDLLEKANNCYNETSEEPNDNIIKDDKFFGGEDIKESNQIQYIYVIYNFIKNSFIKEDAIIEKTNELKGKKTLQLIISNKEGKTERIIEPKIKFYNGEFEYQCLISTQEKILDDLHKQYELFITDLNEDKLNNKILFESCLNIILFIRNTTCFNEMADILDIFKVIFNVYLQKIYSIKKS